MIEHEDDDSPAPIMSTGASLCSRIFSMSESHSRHIGGAVAVAFAAATAPSSASAFSYLTVTREEALGCFFVGAATGQAAAAALLA
jgi:hypothetical protein